MSTHSHSDPTDVVRRLAAEFTLEVTPREPLRAPGLLRGSLRPGTRVFVTYLSNTSFEGTVAAVAAVADEGMRPVPHLAARSVADLAELDRKVGRLVDAGATELLVVAGSVNRPAGEISETQQVLDSGALQHHGITRVHVAGHPEGNKDIGEPGLARALVAKNRWADETGIETHLVTQFGFAAEPVIEWERRIRAEGNHLPIHVGLPGLATPAKLLKFGLACGVGPSLKVLRKQAGSLRKLATASVYYPDQTLAGVADAIASDTETRLAAIHVFPFGVVAETTAWLDTVATGGIDDDVEASR